MSYPNFFCIIFVEVRYTIIIYTSYGIALNDLERPVVTRVDTGIGIVFVLLGRRILDGKPGVSGRGTSLVSVFHCAERNEAAIFCLYATNTSE